MRTAKLRCLSGQELLLTVGVLRMMQRNYRYVLDPTLDSANRGMPETNEESGV